MRNSGLHNIGEKEKERGEDRVYPVMTFCKTAQHLWAMLPWKCPQYDLLADHKGIINIAVIFSQMRLDGPWGVVRDQRWREIEIWNKEGKTEN